MAGRCRVAFRVVTACALMSLLISVSGCAPKTVAAPFTAGPSVTSQLSKGTGVKTIYLAGGCFWGIEKYLDQVHGVTYTEVGYANGASASAAYGDGSGYAEAVRVDYDPAVAPLPFLLRLFYRTIDPTSVDRQGNDVGAEYRSGIYFTDATDRALIVASLAQLQKSHDRPIAIETGLLKAYSRAEDYHQKYLDKNPGGYCHIPLNLFREAAAARPAPSDFPTSTVGID